MIYPRCKKSRRVLVILYNLYGPLLLIFIYDRLGLYISSISISLTFLVTVHALGTNLCISVCTAPMGKKVHDSGAGHITQRERSSPELYKYIFITSSIKVQLLTVTVVSKSNGVKRLTGM